MTFLRNLLRDLVDKKLWPVAVALVLALVAIPVVIGGSSSSDSPPATAGQAPAAPVGDAVAGSTAQVAVAPVDTTAKNRAGKLRNPFKGPKLPKAEDEQADAVDVGADKPAGGSGGTSADDKTDAATTDSTNTDSTTKEETVKGPTVKKTETESEPDIDERWVATLRFGVAGEKRKLKAIPRLAPLPSSENPIIVFLGVLDDHKTALFLIGSDADTSGDGSCKPSKSECETVRMTRDETQFFDVTQDDGSVVQYQLDLDKVRERKVSSKAVAAKAAARKRARAKASQLEDTLQQLGVAVANVPGLQVP